MSGFLVCGTLFLPNNFASSTTFRLRQKVVVPLAICVCSQIGHFSGYPNYADLRSFSSLLIDGVIPLGFCLNSLNRFFTRQTPLNGGISDMRDVLVRAVAVRLRNAVDFKLFHLNSP